MRDDFWQILSENNVTAYVCGHTHYIYSYLVDEVYQLDSGEAGPLFEEVLRNIELMLRHELIHGDLSAYNILYWAGEITLIDFPQVTNPYTNDQAYFIFQRDIERLGEYFGRQGVPCDSEVITDELWARYVGTEPHGPALDEGHLWLD